MDFAIPITFLLLMLSTVVHGDECVVYDFEDFSEHFQTNRELCTGLSSWTLGFYNDTDIAPLNNSSGTFISPGDEISCVSSFTFPLNSDGEIKINTFVDFASSSDIILVLVQAIEADRDVVLAQTSIYDTNGVFQEIDIPLYITGSFESAFIVFLGLADADSTVIVDSFRYIPPGNSSELCEIYEDATDSREENVSNPDPEEENDSNSDNDGDESNPETDDGNGSNPDADEENGSNSDSDEKSGSNSDSHEENGNNPDTEDGTGNNPDPDEENVSNQEPDEDTGSYPSSDEENGSNPDPDEENDSNPDTDEGNGSNPDPDEENGSNPDTNEGHGNNPNLHEDKFNLKITVIVKV